jgi:hypothetical protein
VLTPVIPVTQEAEAGRSKFKVNLGKKLARPNLNQQVSNSINTEGSMKPALGKNTRPYLKNN